MKFTIDWNKWRCGGDGDEGVPHKHGEGDTALLNPEGFMCCLGQVAKQIGYTDEDILDTGTPSELDYPRLTSNILVYVHEDEDEASFKDTKLSDAAMTINDNPDTTPYKKMELLKSLFAEHGHEIEFVNVPVRGAK